MDLNKAMYARDGEPALPGRTLLRNRATASMASMPVWRPRGRVSFGGKGINLWKKARRDALRNRQEGAVR